MSAGVLGMVNTLYGNGQSDGWCEAVQIVCERLERPCKASFLLEELHASVGALEGRRAHRLVLLTLRTWVSVDAALARLIAKRPRAITRAVLMVAGAELGETPEDRHPLVVHHAVSQARRVCSEAEARMVNAVLRRLAFELQREPDPAVRSGHPAWMVQRWRQAFGATATQALLAWNQSAAPVYLRRAGGPPESEGWESTPWPDFYRRVGSGLGSVRAELESGRSYIQDPLTRLPIELLAPQSGESILDMCAAPGGKSLQCLPLLGSSGRLVATDLPGARLERLRQNLQRHAAGRAWTVVPAEGAALGAALAAAQLPAQYDAVIVDVPCSNTGVLRRRPDVKIRLQPSDVAALLPIQSGLLDAAAARVRLGGRLLYSTCSIEPEENEEQVAAFLRRHPAFKLVQGHTALPWQCGHDGGGAFLLTH